MLSSKNSNRLFHFNNNGFNQIDITLNWGLDNNSLLKFCSSQHYEESRMPEEIFATVYVKLPLL